MALRRISAPQLERLLPLSGDAVGPAYRALATTLRALILDGRLPLGVRLPAERELSTALRISRTTTTAAYDLLRREGFLASRRGAGTFTTFPPGSGTVEPGWAAAGGDVIDLSIAAPAALEDAVAAAAARAVEQLPRQLRDDGYHVFGLLALREAVAAAYRSRGLPTRAEEIMITPGAQGAIALVARAFLSPGDAALVESPSYPSALDAFRACGARLIATPVETGAWDTDFLAATFRQTLPRLAYFIPEFHNPTGQLMPEHVRVELARAARAGNSLLIVDESFLGLGLADGLPEPAPVAVHDPDRIVSVGALSKSVWGGLRIGWIRASSSVLQRLGTARASLDMASPILEQLVALELIAELDVHLAARRASLARSLDALTGALAEQLPDWRYLEPQGGLSLWIALDRPSTSLARAAEAEGVRIVPGPRFGPDGQLERFLLFPFALPGDRLREAVTRLARATESVPVFADAGSELAYVV
ncbi:MAG: PLP-dependent aminotransferase family protein [Gaiellaceae bacterium]